jgi:hypothetical protein
VLAELSIPPQECAYRLECAAFWTGINSTSGDAFQFTIYVGNVARASIVERHSGGGNERRSFSVPTTTLVPVPADAGCDISVTVQRTIGTGTIDTDTAGLLTARLHRG